MAVRPMTLLTKTITLSANSSWYLYNFRKTTLREALLRGYKVICISPEDSYHLKLIDMGCIHKPMNFYSSSKNPFLDFIIFLKFFLIYRKIKPDMAFHFTIKNNIYGTLAARLLWIPAVNNVSGLGTAFISFSLSSIIVKLLYKISQPFAYKVFCQNNEDYDYLINHKLVPKKNLALLPGSGVDLKRFNTNLNATANRNSIFTFLFAGRMLKDKGVLELIDAVRHVNQKKQRCKLILCGFSDVDNISAINQETLNSFSLIQGIEWIGPSDSIEEVLALVDCVVLPSYREGMPKILLEAGAMGLPSLASDVPGCRDVIQDGVNGLLFKPKNVQSLKKAIEHMLSMKDSERERMGSSAKRIIEKHFDETIVVNTFFSVLQEYEEGFN
jgi:glycosyltransferase involved in cell wall biosynthesis